MVRRVVSVLRAVAAVVLGVAGGTVVLLAVAALTGWRVVAVLAAALAAALITGGLGRAAARGFPRGSRMRRSTVGGVTAVTSVVLATAMGLMVFAPAPAPTRLAPTENTRYWDLPTGSRIAYTHVRGRGTRRPVPVILVHGGPGAPPSNQQPLMTTLAEAGFDVYSYHQVGAGLSSRLEDVRDYTVARHVADLDAIITEIGADRVALAGSSWGGTLVANYLAAHPARVDRAVVASPSAIWYPAFADGGSLTAAGNRDQQAVIRDYPRFVLAHLVLRVAGPRAARTLLPDRTMDGIFEQVVGRLDMWAGCPGRNEEPPERPAGFGFWANAMTTLDAHRIDDPRPALRHTSTPVLILRGECDYNALPVTHEYRDLLPNATLLVVDDAGHVIEADRPDFYRQAVRAFFEDAPLPAARRPASRRTQWWLAESVISGASANHLDLPSTASTHTHHLQQRAPAEAELPAVPACDAVPGVSRGTGEGMRGVTLRSLDSGPAP